MKVWVTREIKYTVTPSVDHERLVSIWQTKPVEQEDGWFRAFIGSNLLTVTAKTFKKFFGFTPRKGSIGQYELSLTEIEE